MPSMRNKAEQRLRPEEAKSIWSYDSETGLISWRERPVEAFSSENHWKRFCEKSEGKICGTITKRGYVVVSYNGYQYYAHRIAWVVCYGEWPLEYIDHVDRDKLNNRIDNLRVVDPKKNSRNVSMSSRNSSGIVGVSYDESTEVWRARWSNLDGTRGYFGRSAKKWGFEEAKRMATEAYNRAVAELNKQGADYLEGHGQPSMTEDFTEKPKRVKKSATIGRVMSYGKLYWRVQFSGKSRMFSVEKYGEDKARELAGDVLKEVTK